MNPSTLSQVEHLVNLLVLFFFLNNKETEFINTSWDLAVLLVFFSLVFPNNLDSFSQSVFHSPATVGGSTLSCTCNIVLRILLPQSLFHTVVQMSICIHKVSCLQSAYWISMNTEHFICYFNVKQVVSCLLVILLYSRKKNQLSNCRKILWHHDFSPNTLSSYSPSLKRYSYLITWWWRRQFTHWFWTRM